VDLPPATSWEGFKIRWKGYGPREFFRRGLGKMGGGPPATVLSPVATVEPPRLTDERTVAQLRATHWLLGHLDGAAAHRAEIQKRRRRPDLEIFERFPVYLVPTYPGDHSP
jgi:hypothetical protein